MSRVVLCLVAAILFPSVAPGQSQLFLPRPPEAPQTPPRDNTARIGTARIRGHVFAADTGQPLRKAQVRVFSAELRENRMATTDVDGLYEFKDLPAGRYTLMAQKGSFVQLQYGQLRPFEPGKPLEILDGQTVGKVDFTLPRGSVIAGRIVDEFGEPTADVQVMAMRYQYVQGRRRLTPAGRPSMTNDIGEYRIFGLPPGQYYLSATLRGMAIGMDATSDDRSGYAPTYFPGTPSVAEAQRVTVNLGQALSDLNMALAPTRTARISGTAVDSDGKPLLGGFITVLQRTGTMMFGGGGGQVRPDGSFTVSNVSPGEYTLAVNASGGFGATGETSTAQVTVSGDDISGLRLTGVKPSTLTGRIIVDPAQRASLTPSTLRLIATPAHPDDMPFMGNAPGKVNDDFTFELKARPGEQLIRLAPTVLGWSLKTARYGGVDVSDTGIEIRANEDVSGIEVELTNNPSEVSGFVTNTRGESVKDYTVVVFAQDQQRWRFGSRYLGQGRPDQDGRFKLRNLPAGQYYAIALAYVEPGEGSDPEFLEMVRDRALTFRLNEGEIKTLDLKLTSGS